MIISKRMRWAGHVTRMGGKETIQKTKAGMGGWDENGS
jgi:hypothetical protein